MSGRDSDILWPSHPHTLSFPTPLTTGSGQWAATQAAKHQLQAEARESLGASLPGISSSTGDHTGDNVSKWRAARGTLITRPSSGLRRNTQCKWEVTVTSVALSLGMNLICYCSELSLPWLHEWPSTSLNKPFPSCSRLQQLLVQWLQHTKLLLAPYLCSCCYWILECHSPHSSSCHCDSSFKKQFRYNYHQHIFLPFPTFFPVTIATHRMFTECFLCHVIITCLHACPTLHPNTLLQGQRLIHLHTVKTTTQER